MSWHTRFVELAHHIAQWSKDPSTKVGCVLVNPKTHAILSLGFNGFARGVAEETTPDKMLSNTHIRTPLGVLDPVRWARPAKYDYCEHAERNAIYNAARHGIITQGSHAYLNFDPTTSICPDCARALIQAGVLRVYGPALRHIASNAKHNTMVTEMLQEANVSVMLIPHTVADDA